uniref:Uncharacterized protein n=1 Tax=Arundo donax TaxID=35708 RepID=A0A0A8ZJS3_ARUDO
MSLSFTFRLQPVFPISLTSAYIFFPKALRIFSSLPQLVWD